MKLKYIARVGLLFSALSFHAPVIAEGPVYVPPNVRGVPDRLVGGASRSNAPATPVLTVLAPREPGWTSSAQPVLYWYVSQDIDTPITLSLADMAGMLEGRPALMEQTLDGAKAGLHAVDLSERQISLKDDIEYEWSVAFSWPPQTGKTAEATGSDTERSVVMSRATLLLKHPGTELGEQIAGAAPQDLPGLYAKGGFWYDSIAALDKLIQQNPDNTLYQEWRTALLKQEALDKVVSP